MGEERIIITIDEDGKIIAKTEGIKGEMCISELDDILGKDLHLLESKKTDEFYQKNNIVNKRKIENRRK